MASGIMLGIRKDLRESIDPKTRDSGKNFFKEEIKVYGVKTGVVTEIAKKHFAGIKPKGKKEVFSLCEDLLKSGYMEEAFIAYNWAYWIHRKKRISPSSRDGSKNT